MTEIARETGLNRENLYKSLSGEGNPKFTTISKVSKALGCKLGHTPNIAFYHFIFPLLY